jgi:hypothetical protein
MIVDTPWNSTNTLSQLGSGGVTTVIRYYNHSNSTTLPQKCLTTTEAQAVVGKGMRLAVTFQQRQNQVGDFTYQAGELAGKRAFNYASSTIGQPKNSTIYFSVDHDLYKASELSAVAAFFEGVRDAFATEAGPGPCYAVGVYGSGTVLEYLRSKHLAAYFWLAQSTGWSGYQLFKNSDNWHLLQGPQQNLYGLDVDSNEANPNKPNFGAFTLPISPPLTS